MGKFFAAVIIVVSFIKLAPMCARLPSNLAAVSGEAPAAPEPVAVSTEAAPAAAPVAPVPAAASAPAPRVVEPTGKSSVTVNTYRMKRPFRIVDGRAMVSVSVRNAGETGATDMRLTLTTRLGGKNAEKTGTGRFELAASTSVYRGLYITTASLDALLAEPAEEGAELRWDLTYRLESDAPEVKRCFTWRALPRAKEPEGADWKEFGTSQLCEEKKP